jgi:hypothetical protein
MPRFTGSDGCGKGSDRRPLQTGIEEFNLRTALWEKRITFEQFEKKYNKLLREGKITRSGRVVGNVSR